MFTIVHAFLFDHYGMDVIFLPLSNVAIANLSISF
jgi:hypothetical protein